MNDILCFMDMRKKQTRRIRFTPNNGLFIRAGVQAYPFSLRYVFFRGFTSGNKKKRFWWTSARKFKKGGLKWWKPYKCPSVPVRGSLICFIRAFSFFSDLSCGWCLNTHKKQKPKIKPRKAALSFFGYRFALLKPKRTQPRLIPV